MQTFKRLNLLFLCLLLSFLAESQQKYWVSSSTSLPDTLKVVLGEPENCSEWLKSCSYQLDKISVDVLIEAGYPAVPVISYQPLNHSSGITYGFALEQVQAKLFREKKLDGKGIKIGIIDGGFLGANKDPSLKHLFDKGLVKWYKDYITPDLEPYGGMIRLDDNHGTEVWQLIGGFDEQKQILYGLATNAEYYLARTDHGAYEKRIEEDYLIKAMEDMEKMGIKLINVSLGYNLGFSNPKENYLPSQMDGKTSMLAKAVDYAALDKGMLIVVAAGNEASEPWKTLSTPGDARFALTVGASKFETWDKIDYSSIGPDYTDFPKPDVSVYSTLGTSYSTPIITGMAACMWQMDSTLTNLEIIDIFKKAGNFYPYPNNYLGYGVPTCSNILKVMNENEPDRPKTIQVAGGSYKLKGPFDARYLVAFHKKDDRNVIARVVYRPSGDKVKIKRLEGAQQTSVLIGKEVIEVFWE